MANPKTEIDADLERYASLDAFKSSEGGQVLIKSFIEDIVAEVDALADGYRTMPHIEMIARCAAIAERRDVLRTLLNARTNQALAKEALKEVMGAEPDIGS